MSLRLVFTDRGSYIKRKLISKLYERSVEFLNVPHHKKAYLLVPGHEGLKPVGTATETSWNIKTLPFEILFVILSCQPRETVTCALFTIVK